jgi:nitrate reductase molybdenum cofactor assembly chaperone NarJ/NarW
VIVLRALSALLSYPTAELRQALPEVAAVVRSSPLVAERERGRILALIEELAGGDLLDAEERYVALFDRGRATSLHLFEHLHGDSRDRGDAMVELKRLYEGRGFALASNELPDYLPVLLEYLSCRDLAEARDMLADCARILKKIAEALIARDSAYAGVLQALIVIAGEPPVDAASVPKVQQQRENLDRDWFEEPAFAGVPLTAGHDRTGGKAS